MIRMKVVCCIIQKIEMVPAVAGDVVAMAAVVAVDVVAVIMADTSPEGTMMVALLPLVLQMRCKDELICRPRAILRTTLSFCRIT